MANFNLHLGLGSHKLVPIKVIMTDISSLHQIAFVQMFVFLEDQMFTTCGSGLNYPKRGINSVNCWFCFMSNKFDAKFKSGSQFWIELVNILIAFPLFLF